MQVRGAASARVSLVPPLSTGCRQRRQARLQRAHAAQAAESHLVVPGNDAWAPTEGRWPRRRALRRLMLPGRCCAVPCGAPCAWLGCRVH